MATIKNVVKISGKSKQTVINWVNEFADYLSPEANPPKGQTRRFNDEDMAVLILVAQMRAEEISYADIGAALAAGQRGEVPPINEQPNQARTDERQTSAGELVPIDLLESFALRISRQYEGQITSLEKQLADERQAHQNALERAVRAETERDMLSQNITPKNADSGRAGRPWWRFWD